MTEPKFETVKEFLERGGTITKIPPVENPTITPMHTIGCSKTRYEPKDWEEESRFEHQPKIKLIDYFNRRRDR